MEGHRRVTEEDLHVTEALIADSFGRLKRSIAEAPHEAIRPAANMIREHPFARDGRLRPAPAWSRSSCSR